MLYFSPLFGLFWSWKTIVKYCFMWNWYSFITKTNDIYLKCFITSFSSIILLNIFKPQLNKKYYSFFGNWFGDFVNNIVFWCIKIQYGFKYFRKFVWIIMLSYVFILFHLPYKNFILTSLILKSFVFFD